MKAQSTPRAESSVLARTLRIVVMTMVVPTLLYTALIFSLITYPSIEAHLLYMHRISRMASLEALNTPELFGFMRNQVRPFTIPMPEAISIANLTAPATATAPPAASETLHAWHVLPLNCYHCHSAALIAEPAGLPEDMTATHGFSLLRDDPEAIVVIQLHGASGTMASRVRPQTYRALSAADPVHIHVLALDYRGYGLSSGSPSEGGLIADAIALAQWAMDVARVPPERIVVHGQSLGTAVAIGMVEHFAMQEPPVEFSGLVLTAGMYDVASLTPEYRFNGIIRVMAPLDLFPSVLTWMTTKLRSTWKSGERLQRIVQKLDRYHIELLHAEDDMVVSLAHVHSLFRAAVRGTTDSHDMAPEELDAAMDRTKTDPGTSGATWEWQSDKGVIMKHVLPLGEHDILMTLPATGEAIWRASLSGSKVDHLSDGLSPRNVC